MAIDFSMKTPVEEIPVPEEPEVVEIPEEVFQVEEIRADKVQGYDPLDLEAAKKKFANVHKQLQEMVKQAEAVEIKDEATIKDAVAKAGQAKKLSKKIEDERKNLLLEPAAFTKSLNAFCRTFTDKLAEIETGLKRKIGLYQAKAELERRAAEKKAQEAAAKLQAELDKEADEKGVERVEVVAPVVPKHDKVARSDTGSSASIRRVMKAEIVDESLVPRDYCEPSMKLINEAVKMGIREIAGVRIFEDVQTVLRT